MSSNGTRKQTLAFETAEKTASGRLFNITTDDIPIEELPNSGPTVVNNAPVIPPEAMAPMQPGRVRKTTLEKFNDEMSLLDRPIEGDVEYIDEAPRPSRMKGVALFAGVVLGLGMGGGVVLSRRHATPPVSAQAAQPAAAPVAAAPPAAAPIVETAPVLAAQIPAAPTAAAPDPEAAADPAADEEASAPDDDAAAAPAPTPGAWGKLKGKAGHEKHARVSAKSAHHGKRSVASKHSSSRHH